MVFFFGRQTMSEATSPRQLDTRGLMCPEPVMLLHNAVRDIDSGDLLEVLATDPSTQRDIPRFCSFLGHELVETAESEGIYRYLIRKQS
jgi:tRNA 2-thiouridine synthesizing protein A